MVIYRSILTLQKVGTVVIYRKVAKASKEGNIQGILLRGRLSMVDLLIKAACFVKNVNNIFNIKRS
jgi:hypothetical protein